jgi:hypothetical protein
MSRIWISAMVLGGLLVIGCEKSEKPTTAASPAAPAMPATPATPSADASKDATAVTGGAATTAPAVPPPAAAAAVDAKTAEAQKLLDQATEYIKENKLDLADKTLTQLEGMKASLPPEWASKIDTARKSLTAAKASGLIGK